MKDIENISEMMADIGRRAKAAAADLASAPAEAKEAALLAAADAVWDSRADIIAANAKDMEYGREKGLSGAMMDRLMLDEDRIKAIADGLRSVAGQADPVGEVLAEWDQPSGLHIKRVRTPLGVIGVIYESRPNVTADAGALCLKAGNAVILRGGSESFHSARAIHASLQKGLRSADLPQQTIGQGVIRALMDAGVDVRVDQTFVGIDGTTPATDDDWGKEYLDMIIAAKSVESVEDAIAHIQKYGSSHTDCIITEDSAAVETFMNRLDSAILMHNASTQFADGAEFGMGAEIGIATGKMHARGPVGAAQLTSFKYLVTGNGTIRT